MTDEQIFELARKHVHYDMSVDTLAFARAILAASIADTAGAKWKGAYEAENKRVLRLEAILITEFGLGKAQKLIADPPAPSVADAAGASETLPENIDWTRVMALAEKHGDGWSEAKGWSFHCDDDLFNFVGELAKERAD